MTADLQRWSNTTIYAETDGYALFRDNQDETRRSREKIIDVGRRFGRLRLTLRDDQATLPAYFMSAFNHGRK